MAGPNPIHSGSAPPGQTAIPWPAVIAVPVLILLSMTMCMCGHLDWFSLPLSAGAATLGWWSFTRRAPPSFWRVLVIVIVLIASLALLKNLADILWFGHEPLLRRTRF